MAETVFLNNEPQFIPDSGVVFETLWIAQRAEVGVYEAEASGRQLGYSVCEDGDSVGTELIIAPLPFRSTVPKSLFANSALAEATKSRVLGVEFPGHGRSSRLTRQEALKVQSGDSSWFASDIMELVNSEIIGGREVRKKALGHSMGALAVSELAVQFPRAFDSLVLLNPANLAPRGPINNIYKFIRGNMKKPQPLLDDWIPTELPAEIQDWPGVTDPRVYMLTLRKTVVNGATTRNLIQALEENPELTATLIVGENCEVARTSDVEYLYDKIKQRTPSLAERLGLVVVSGETHNLGKHPYKAASIVSKYL